MSKTILNETLWNIIQPLIPPEPNKPKGGRPRIPNKNCLTGILFVLRTGIPWELLPQEMGCGTGMTCWRRLRDWQHAGVWDALHNTLLTQLHQAEQIDWTRACLDSSTVPAPKGGKRRGRIQRIAENRERNAILWSKSKGYPSRSG